MNYVSILCNSLIAQQLHRYAKEMGVIVVHISETRLSWEKCRISLRTANDIRRRSLS